MIRSMTSYGSAAGSNGVIDAVVEMRSENSRFLEVKLRCPKSCFGLEDRLQKMVKQKFSRGKITGTVTLQFSSVKNSGFQLDRAKVEKLKTIIETLRKDYREEIFLKDIVRLDDIILGSEPDSVETEMVCGVFEKAISGLAQMAENEGKVIGKDLIGRLTTLTSDLKFLDERSDEIKPLNFEKYKSKIAALISENSLTESRIIQEAGIQAEKVDITEECVRLKSHIMQFEDFLRKGGEVGKRLTFILQEMGREINTIGSKSEDLIIIQKAVDVKDEIEKIREQVQNII